MKKTSLLLIGFLLVLTSCDGGGDDPTIVQEPAFTTLKNYMVNNGYDIPNILVNSDGAKFVTAPPATEAEIPAFLAKYHVIDIRAKADFDAGHIAGAKNVAFGDVLAEGAQGKPVLIVCYSGQTACYATSLMRLYGFNGTKALKWGMSGWSPTHADASWNKKIGANEAEGHANWSFGSAPANLIFTDPVISSLKTDGEQLLKERVERIVAEGAKYASGSDILANPSGFFVNNYFSSTDYAGFGHIEGAYRINPLTLAGNEYLNLDPTPGAKVVTYCYTGQTSAVVTAYLRVIGYDAYSLVYGMNGMYNTNTAWSSNQWGVTGNPKNYPTVTTN